MFCPNCGQENPPGAGSCVTCGQSIAEPAGLPAAAAPPPAPPIALPGGLGTLLGGRGPEIQWGAGAAFLVASILASPTFLIIVSLLQHRGSVPLYEWWLSFSAHLLLTGAAVAAFRWVRNDAGAAALASAAYTVLQTANRLLLVQLFFRGPQASPIFLFSSFLATFLFLLILALAVRMIRPTWLGLGIGTTAAHLASSLVYHFGSFLYLRMRGTSSFSFLPGSWEVAGWLVSAAVFAFAFWGGLALFAPRVLRDS